MLLVLALMACKGEDAAPIGGFVRVGPGSAATPMDAGSVQVLDGTGALYSEAEIGPDGRFDAFGPIGTRIHVVVDGPGMVPAGFTGTMGIGAFELPDGTLFGWPEADRAALDTTWAGCAEPGPALIAEVRMFGVTDDDGVSPLITTAYAEVTDASGAALPACYLADAEPVYDPAAEQTGDRGEFAVFGLEPGLIELDYGYTVAAGVTVDETLELYLPEGGVTPLVPAWLDLYLP